MRCLFCNTLLEGQSEIRAKTCTSCADKGKVSTDAVQSGTAAWVPSTGEEEEDHDPKLGGTSWRPGRFVIFLGVLLAVWLVLALLASTEPWAGWALIGVGAAPLLVGIFWTYYVVAENGIDLREFGSNFGAMKTIIVLVQLITMPVFALFFVFLGAEEAWRPFVLQLFGIGMIACGVFFLR